MTSIEKRTITLFCKECCVEFDEVVSVAVDEDGFIDAQHLSGILSERKLCCPHCETTNQESFELSPTTALNAP